MISAELKEDNKYVHFRINGHANYKVDVYDFDIVCGLVSVLAQTALQGCCKHCKDVKLTMDDGKLEFYFPKNYDKAKAIAAACFDGIQAVKEEYPQCFK